MCTISFVPECLRSGGVSGGVKFAVFEGSEVVPSGRWSGGVRPTGISKALILSPRRQLKEFFIFYIF
jgi:hypothetical protein